MLAASPNGRFDNRGPRLGFCLVVRLVKGCFRMVDDCLGFRRIFFVGGLSHLIQRSEVSD